LINCETVHR